MLTVGSIFSYSRIIKSFRSPYCQETSERGFLLWISCYVYLEVNQTEPMVLKFQNMRVHLEIFSFFSVKYRFVMVLQKCSVHLVFSSSFLFFFWRDFKCKNSFHEFEWSSQYVLPKFTAQKINNFASYI